MHILSLQLHTVQELITNIPKQLKSKRTFNYNV